MAGIENVEPNTTAETLEKEFDVIIACTGYQSNFDWIQTSDPELKLNPNTKTWFKHCFPPGFSDKLAFLGFARPHSGGIPQCSEMLARYIAQLYAGALSLPNNYSELALMEGANEEACYHKAFNPLLVDYFAFMELVAKMIGCTTKLPWSPHNLV